MTIYGLIATVFICTTCIICVALITTQAIKVHITRETIEQPNPVYVPAPTPAEPEEDAKDIAVKGMDAVISAVNDLMGITTEESNEQAK